jgi:excisionase family DNA binding protein
MFRDGRQPYDLDETNAIANNGGMTTMIVSQGFLSAQEVAVALGLTDGRVRQMVKSGLIHAERLGQRSWAIPSSEVDRLRKSRENPAQSSGAEKNPADPA